MQNHAARFGLLFDAIDQGVCVIEMQYDADGRGTDFIFLQTNAAFANQCGLQGAVGRSIRSYFPNHDQHWFDMYAEVARTGVPIRTELPAVAMGRWFDVYAFRIDDPSQHHVAIVFSDVTQRKADKEMLILMANELNHRVQNTLTVVASIVQLTDCDSVTELREIVLGRINALSNSQQILLRNDGRSAALHEIIERELEGFRSKKQNTIVWSGPEVDLDASSAKPIAMAIHELATNASKYGALSLPTGAISVAWQWCGNDTLEIKWTESGGPRVTPPARRGLGSDVIDACVKYSGRDGGADFQWRPEGLECTLRQAVKQVKIAPHISGLPADLATIYRH